MIIGLYPVQFVGGQVDTAPGGVMTMGLVGGESGAVMASCEGVVG